jgi:hypothetical protein
LVRLTDESGSSVFCDYDALNRLTQRLIDRAPGIVGVTRNSYEYDGLSRVVRATADNGPLDATSNSDVAVAYDSLDRIIEESQQIGAQPPKIISTSWRAENLPTKLIYPNGRAIHYLFDRLDRVRRVSDPLPGAPIAEYSYLGSRVAEREYPISGSRMTYLDDDAKVDVGYDGRPAAPNPATPRPRR